MNFQQGGLFHRSHCHLTAGCMFPGLAALQRRETYYLNFIAKQLYTQNSWKSRKIQY